MTTPYRARAIATLAEQRHTLALIAVGDIICRRYLCCLCADRLEAGLKEASKGPEAFLRAIATHDGMLCGAAEWMKYRAIEALGANARTELTRPAQ